MRGQKTRNRFSSESTRKIPFLQNYRFFPSRVFVNTCYKTLNNWISIRFKVFFSLKPQKSSGSSVFFMFQNCASPKKKQISLLKDFYCSLDQAFLHNSRRKISQQRCVSYWHFNFWQTKCSLITVNVSKAVLPLLKPSWGVEVRFNYF